VGCLFRLLCVAEDEASQPVRVVEACLDQLLERGSPCSLGIRRQGATGVAQLILSNSGPSPVPTHQAPKTFNPKRRLGQVPSYQPMLTTSVGAAMPLSSSVRSAVTGNERGAASRVVRLTRISDPLAAAPMRAARLTPVPT
jgi:hypothetical protein